MKHICDRKTFFLSTVLLICCVVASPVSAVSQYIPVGEILLVSAQEYYGAIRPVTMSLADEYLCYEYLFLPWMESDTASAERRFGTAEVQLVDSRGLLSFGKFVVEWQGGIDQQVVFGSNPMLGLQPLYTAVPHTEDFGQLGDIARRYYPYVLSSPAEIPPKFNVTEWADRLSTQGFLGVGVRRVLPATDEIALSGVIVNRVAEESPAEKAGIKPGDLIYRLQGSLITRPEEFDEILRNLHPGTLVQIDLFRDEEFLRFRTHLTDRPPPPGPAFEDRTRQPYEEPEIKEAVVEQIKRMLHGFSYF